VAKLPFYYVHGNDTDIIEKKWLPNLKAQNPKADFTWLDTSLDDIDIPKLVSDFSSYNIFCDKRVLVVRNADSKQEDCFELAQALEAEYLGDNILVFLAGSLNQTTKLGKFVKRSFIIEEFNVPEVKPFALLDAVSMRNSKQILQQCRHLLDNDYNSLALYSMIYGHLILMKKVKELEGDSPDWVARKLGENPFRIKKVFVANRYWSRQEIDDAILTFTELGKRLRSWQHEEDVLLQMALIKIGL
jgi:DNA polymerase III delta subunit